MVVLPLPGDDIKFKRKIPLLSNNALKFLASFSLSSNILFFDFNYFYFAHFYPLNIFVIIPTCTWSGNIDNSFNNLLLLIL